MLAYLPRLVILLWITLAVFQMVLAALLLWRRVDRRYPAFALFVHYQALKTVLLLAIKGVWVYFWAYYASSIISCVLMALIVGEIYLKVFGPKIALPAWVPRSVAAWLAGAVASCAGLGIALRPLGVNRYLTIMGGLQSALISAVLLSLIILVFYSRYLGISWQRRPAFIVAGFIFFLSVNTNTFFVLGLASRPTAENARTIGMISYIVSLAWWAFALRGREVLPEMATPEQVREMLHHHGRTMKTATQVK